jgi:2',3'-cyclic-nucleotide 2'-phosphodiesterase/3'-nucleotidase
MKKKIFKILLVFLFSGVLLNAQNIRLQIIETTDTHGSIFPYDFVNAKKVNYSLSQIYSYVKEQRADSSQSVILISDGDIIQGTPVVYYYNFVDTAGTHLYARVMNFMQYDAATVGNHDIEAGHRVYDKLVRQFHFPWMAANAVVDSTGKPYFQPYVILRRRGIKIALLGLITPAIPNWLPPQIYSGMVFEDMIESARHWVKIIREKEKPDLLIGMFHAGVDYTYGGQNEDTYKNENASLLVAEKVPGFDVVFVGHDHHGWNRWVENVNGDSVLLLGGTHAAQVFAVANIAIKKEKGKMFKELKGKLIPSKKFKPDETFLNEFEKDFEAVKKYVMQPIGYFTRTVSTREALFGDSRFVDLIHNIQLDISKADISFAAPLSFDTKIEKGKVYVKDMFKLYHYENFLYTMSLSGKEIKDYLEYSYGNWLNQMKNENDDLLNFEKDESGNLIYSERNHSPILASRFYNFDCAEGINYTVDVTKPVGKRITIKGFSDGRPFNLTSFYKVAVNSYRGNGGGGLLTKGAGIPHSELLKRLITSTDRDLRFYMMEWIKKHKTVTPTVDFNWEIIPSDWAKKGKAKDYKLLFGDERNSH